MSYTFFLSFFCLFLPFVLLPILRSTLCHFAFCRCFSYLISVSSQNTRIGKYRIRFEITLRRTYNYFYSDQVFNENWIRIRFFSFLRGWKKSLPFRCNLLLRRLRGVPAAPIPSSWLCSRTEIYTGTQ